MGVHPTQMLAGEWFYYTPRQCNTYMTFTTMMGGTSFYEKGGGYYFYLVYYIYRLCYVFKN